MTVVMQFFGTNLSVAIIIDPCKDGISRYSINIKLCPSEGAELDPVQLPVVVQVVLSDQLQRKQGIGMHALLDNGINRNP